MAGDDWAPGRRAVRSALATCSVLAALVVATAGCSSSSSQENGGAAPADPCAMPNSTGQPPTVACRSVEVNGQVFRYGVSVGEAPGKVVLVDLGGPGRTLFSSVAPREFAERWPGNETLVFLEEPWVQAGVSAPCRASLRSRYDALTDRDDSGADTNLRENCRLGHGRWGWGHADYQSAASAALEAEGARLVGTVGISFGAWRTAEIWEAEDPEFAILASPPKRQWDAQAYVEDRSAAALQIVSAACSACSGEAGARELIDRAASLLSKDPQTVPGRTPTVTGGDVYAATFAMGYLAETARSKAVAALAEPLVRENAQVIGALSDSLLLRYGVNDVPASALAYFDEICRDLGQFPHSSGPGQLGSWFQRFHEPCAGGEHNPRTLGEGPPSMCIGVSSADAVTPRALESWVAEFRQAETVRLAGSTHGDPVLVDRCYEQLHSHKTAKNN